MSKQISVPDEIYHLLKNMKGQSNITLGRLLYYILDNSQFFEPTDNNLGYPGGQFYDMTSRMDGWSNEGLKPLEVNPREWHKSRGAAQDTYQKDEIIAELINMIETYNG